MSLEIRTFDGNAKKKRAIIQRIEAGELTNIDFTWEIETGIEQWYGHMVFHLLSRMESTVPSFTSPESREYNQAVRENMRSDIHYLRKHAFKCIKRGINLEPTRLSIQQWLLCEYFTKLLDMNRNPHRKDIAEILQKLALVRRRKTAGESVHQDEWAEIERLSSVARQRLISHRLNNRENEMKTSIINEETPEQRAKRIAGNFQIDCVCEDREVLFRILNVVKILHAKNTPPAVANALREALNATESRITGQPTGAKPQFKHYKSTLITLIGFAKEAT